MGNGSEDERRIYEPVRVDEREGIPAHRLLHNRIETILNQCDLNSPNGPKYIRELVAALSGSLFPDDPDAAHETMQGLAQEIARGQAKKDLGLPVWGVVPPGKMRKFEAEKERYVESILPDSV